MNCYLPLSEKNYKLSSGSKAAKASREQYKPMKTLSLISKWSDFVFHVASMAIINNFHCIIGSWEMKCNRKLTFILL